MTTTIRCSDFELYIRECTILIESTCGRQGILTFERRDGKLVLYKWFNEGRFPHCLDTMLDDGYRSRLKIVGADEV
jgi:hypothetical protein